jgi:hypothetical protein
MGVNVRLHVQRLSVFSVVIARPRSVQSLSPRTVCPSGAGKNSALVTQVCRFLALWSMVALAHCAFVLCCLRCCTEAAPTDVGATDAPATASRFGEQEFGSDDDADADSDFLDEQESSSEDDVQLDDLDDKELADLSQHAGDGREQESSMSRAGQCEARARDSCPDMV